MERKNGGLEDDFPFQLDEFLGSVLNFRGVVYCLKETRRKKNTASQFHDRILINVLFFETAYRRKNISCELCMSWQKKPFISMPCFCTRIGMDHTVTLAGC